MGPLRTRTDRPRGIVHVPGGEKAGGAQVRHLRFEPPEPLRACVEHLWLVHWSLPPGQAQEASTLPHPTVHWLVEGGGSELTGVDRGRFVRRLSGTGRVVAVKFRPAGFCAFTSEPLHRLTDRTVPAVRYLGAAAERTALELDALEAEDAAARLATVLAGLERREDPAADEARALVEHIASGHEVTRVETVARHAGVSVLALQRLFRAKVGVSPKWVIQRYRMHEALAQVTDLALARPGPPRLAGLAYALGFTDQAHFCRVFRQFIGQSPAAYAQQVRRQHAGAPDMASSVKR